MNAISGFLFMTTFWLQFLLSSSILISEYVSLIIVSFSILNNCLDNEGKVVMKFFLLFDAVV